MPPEISEQKLESLQSRKEKKETNELGVDKFVRDINHLLDASGDRLSDLPETFQNAFHDNVVQYLLTSAQQYDTNTEQGLSKDEFEKYKDDMLRKVDEIIARYTPSEEMLDAREQQSDGGAKAIEAGEKASTQEITDVAFNEANLESPQGLQQELATFNAQGEGIRKETASLSGDIANFHKAYELFETGKKDWGVFLRGIPFVSDPETEQLKTSLRTLKRLLDTKVQQLQEKKRMLAEYGQKMNQAGDTLKRQKIEERDKKLRGIDTQGTQAEQTQRKNEREYQALELQQQELYGQRDAMADYHDGLVQRLAGISEAREQVRVKSDQMQMFGGQLENALSTIDAALGNSTLSSPQRETLLARKQELLEHKGAIDTVFSQTQQFETQSGSAKQSLQGKLGEAGSTLLTLDSYLSDTVNPSLEALSSSLQALELAKLKNGTQREQVGAQYAEIFQTIDTVDAAIADNVLENNLANEQALADLELQRQSLDAVDIDKPNIWNGTVGLVFGKAGEGISLLTKEVICGMVLDPASAWLKKVTKDVPVLNVLTGIGTNLLLDLPSGVIEGAGELVNGVATMVAHPIDTVVGLGALIGRDPRTGEWSLSNVGNTWREMGKAIIAYENFEKGQWGKGVGKVALNVLLTATGIGAGAKGTQVAGLTFKLARQSGAGLTRATLETAWAGSKAFSREFGRRAWTDGLQRVPGKFHTFAKESIGKMPARLETFWAGKIKGKTFSEFATDVRGVAQKQAATLQQTLKGLSADIADKLKSNSVKKFIKEEMKLKANALETSDDFVKLQDKVDEMMRAHSDMTREEALQKLLENPVTQNLVLNGMKHEKIQAQLSELQRKINDKIFSPEINQYTDDLGNVSLFGDDMGKFGEGGKMFKKYNIDVSALGRKKALDELLKAVQGKDEIAKVERWIQMNEKYGQQLDEFNNLSSKIKKRRSEGYAWHDDQDFQAFARERGVDDMRKLDADAFSKLRETFLQKNLDDLIQKSGLDIGKELQRKRQALYNAENGMQSMDVNALKIKNYDEIQNAFREHIQQFSEGPNAVLTRDAARLIQKQIDDVVATAKEAGIGETDLAFILNDSADNLIYQTMESYGRQLGDHGIRHIAGNIRANLRIMQEYERAGIPFTAQDRLQMMITQINHDMGYTSAIDLKGFTGTGAHPAISAHLLESGPMKEIYVRIFGEQGYGRVKQAILNHDGVEVMAVFGAADIDAAFMNAVKYADNLALYSFDKLPPIFYENAECAKILGQIEQAVITKKPQLLVSLKNQMRAQILKMEASGEITTNIARGLNNAIDEVNTVLSAKSTLGMMAGQHSDDLFAVTKNPEGNLVPTLRMEGSAAFDVIEEALRKGDVAGFDASTKAFMKIMEDYADKNHCVVKIGDEVIFKPGDDFGSASQSIKDAIRHSDDREVVFLSNGHEMMKVLLRRPNSVQMLRSAHEAEFCQALDTASRLKVVEKAKGHIEQRLSAIDAELKKSALDGAQKTRLVHEHTALQVELRYLKDFEIATDILKNTKEIKNLRSLESLVALLEDGKLPEASIDFRKMASAFISEDRSKILDILVNKKFTSQQKAVEIHGVIESFYDRLFRKHDITPADKQRIKSLIQRSNIIEKMQASTENDILPIDTSEIAGRVVDISDMAPPEN